MSILKNAHAGEFYYYRPITAEVLNEYGFVLKNMNSRIGRWDYEGVDIAEITRNRQANMVSDLYNNLPDMRDRDSIYQEYYNGSLHYAVQFTFLGQHYTRKIKHEKDLARIIDYFKAVSKKRREDTAAILYDKLCACDWETPNCSYDRLVNL